jgi:transposase
MRLYEDNILPKPVILEYLGLSSRTFDRVLALWNATGDVVRQTNGVLGWPRLLHYKDIDYLKCLIQHRPNWFLDELQHLLLTNRFIAAHFVTVHRELVRAGISSKKIRKIASERNEDLRADFIARMAQYTPEQLGTSGLFLFSGIIILSGGKLLSELEPLSEPANSSSSSSSSSSPSSPSSSSSRK